MLPDKKESGGESRKERERSRGPQGDKSEPFFFGKRAKTQHKQSARIR